MLVLSLARIPSLNDFPLNYPVVTCYIRYTLNDTYSSQYRASRPVLIRSFNIALVHGLSSKFVIVAAPFGLSLGLPFRNLTSSQLKKLKS